MAWWDHEDLKSHEYKSDRYRLTFPSEFTPEQVAEARRNEEENKWPIKETIRKSTESTMEPKLRRNVELLGIKLDVLLLSLEELEKAISREKSTMLMLREQAALNELRYESSLKKLTEVNNQIVQAVSDVRKRNHNAG